METVPALYNYATEDEVALAERINATMYRYDNPATNHIDSLANVTEADIADFWRQGYMVVDNVFTQEEVNTSLEAIMDIIMERVKGPQLQFVKPRDQLKNDFEKELAIRKIERFVEHDPRLHYLAYHEGMLQLLGSLFTDTPKLVQQQGILKPPYGGAEKPWHQDMAYGNLTYEKPVIGVWIALDPAEADNGCMHVIPRSHMEGPVPHYAVRDWQVCDTSVRVEQDVIVPLAPGGVLIFHGMTLHGTPPNFSEKRRRSVQFHYAPEAAVKMSPKEYKRWFTNEMTKAEC
ncbi:Ectoine hydroxylase-related dioxygenase, phytanoyl-CoA dioxygenase (PhyH) family [Paenibacillus sp. 1_12]|uniref:phytanoyl-CoA dioxygenase family protein n=1 Tax=Paenibacillus sp. 1_12 TaxID=1566278 RepID=UPI0008E3A5D3|nr:phytanoyl-CoA dioxygenase family protein [Paenibacillus sp. 1_12]SFL75458.1 Ectoine hydroxylase-related dioxygenase, phytanoyl-CoA dioxygenase (PhyH) family [Paenibacillus sp. 1_12]